MAATNNIPDFAESPMKRIFSSTNLVLLMVCLMYALTYIDRINVATAGPVFQKELHLSANQLGSVLSAFGWAYLVLQVWGGLLSDRFGARLTLTVCAVVWAGSTLLMGLAHSLTGLILCRVLLGLGEGATFPTATRALADWMPAEKRGFAQGITHAYHCDARGTAKIGQHLSKERVEFVWIDIHICSPP